MLKEILNYILQPAAGGGGWGVGKEHKEQQWAYKSAKQAEISEVLIVLKEATSKILENSKGGGSWWLGH